MLLKADIDHAVIYVCTCFATNGENQFSDLELAHQHAQWFQTIIFVNENPLYENNLSQPVFIQS